MTIEEAREKKKELERDLKERINKFQEETKLYVSSVRLRHYIGGPIEVDIFAGLELD